MRYNYMWNKIVKLMVDTHISFNELCFVFDLTPQDLDKFRDDEYDINADPNTKKIEEIIDFYYKWQEEENLKARFECAQKISPKGHINLVDINEPLGKNKKEKPKINCIFED